MANVSISQLISDIIGLKTPMAEAVSEFERLQAKMAMSGKRTDELSKKIVELQNGLSSMSAKDIEEVNKQIVDLQNKVGELAKSTSESVSRSVELLPEYIRECVKVIEAEGAKGAEAMGKAFKVASENIGEAFDRLGASRELIDEVFGKISDKGAVLSTLWLNASGVKNDSTGVEMVSTYERLLSVRDRIADSAQKQNEADRTSLEWSKEELAINEQRDRLTAALMSVKGVSDDKTETLREQRQILVEFEDELKRANAEWNSFQSQSFQRATDPSIIQQRKEEIDALTKSVEEQRTAVKQLEEEYNNQLSVESIMDKINNGGAEEKSDGLKELKAIYRSLSDEMRENEEIGGVILRNIQMLNGETRQMNSELGKSVTATGEVNTQGMRMRTMLMTLKQEIMQNTQTLNGYDAEIASLTEKMSEMERNGQVNTEEYTQAAKAVEELNEKRNRLMETTSELIIRTGEYQRVMGSTNALVQNMADPTLGMKAMAGTLNEVVQVGTAATSVMTLFGIKNDDVAKGIMKLQALQSIANTTQRITNDLLSKNGTLQKWHALAVKARILYRKQLNIEQKKAIANEAGLTGATAANTAATNVASAANIGLAGTLRAVGAAMKAVPVIGWIMAAVAAVGTLAGLIVSLNSEERKMTIADKDRIKIREKESEVNLEVQKSMEGERTKLAMNIMMMRETKEGTAEWKREVGDVAKTLGLSEEYVIKNKERVEELAKSWNELKVQQQLADEYVKAAADAKIAAEEQIMKASMGSRKEQKEASKELEGLTRSEQRQYERANKNKKSAEMELNRYREKAAELRLQMDKAESDQQRAYIASMIAQYDNAISAISGKVEGYNAKINGFNEKVREHAEKVSQTYLDNAKSSEEAAKAAQQEAEEQFYASKEAQRMNAHLQTRQNIEADIAKSLALGNIQMDMNVSHLGQMEKGSAEYNKTVKQIAKDLGVNDQWLSNNIDKVGELAEAWKKVRIAEAMSGKFMESAADEAAEFEKVRLLALTGIGEEALDEMLKNNKFIDKATADEIKSISAQYAKEASTTQMSFETQEKYRADIDKALAGSKKKQEEYTNSMLDMADKEIKKAEEESKMLAKAQANNKKTMKSATDAAERLKQVSRELEELGREGQTDNYTAKLLKLEKEHAAEREKYKGHKALLEQLDILYAKKKEKLDEEEKKRQTKVLTEITNQYERLKMEIEGESIKIQFEENTRSVEKDLTLTAKQKAEKLIEIQRQYESDMVKLEEDRNMASLVALQREFETKVAYLNLTTDAEKETNEEYKKWKELYDAKMAQQQQQADDKILDIKNDTADKVKELQAKSLTDEFEQEMNDRAVQRTIDRSGKEVDALTKMYDERANIYENLKFLEEHTYEDLNMTEEEYYRRKNELEAQSLEKSAAIAEQEKQMRAENVRNITDSLGSLASTMAGFIEDEVERVKVEQMIALAQVAINQGLAISEAIAAIMEAKDMGTSAAVIAQKAISIGIAVATITAQMVSSIQAIKAAKTNISEYAEGTDYHRGGDAIVGEGGSPELVIARNRKYLIEKPTLIRDLPVGSKVLPLDGRRGDMVDLSNIERGIDSLNGKSMVRIDVGRNVYSYIVKGASKTRVINKQFAH